MAEFSLHSDGNLRSSSVGYRYCLKGEMEPYSGLARDNLVDRVKRKVYITN